MPPKLCAQGYGQTAFTEFWQFSFENVKQGHFYILTNSALLPGNPSLVGAQRTYTKEKMHEYDFNQYRNSQEWMILFSSPVWPLPKTEVVSSISPARLKLAYIWVPLMHLWHTAGYDACWFASYFPPNLLFPWPSSTSLSAHP